MLVSCSMRLGSSGMTDCGTIDPIEAALLCRVRQCGQDTIRPGFSARFPAAQRPGAGRADHIPEAGTWASALRWQVGPPGWGLPAGFPQAWRRAGRFRSHSEAGGGAGRRSTTGWWAAEPAWRRTAIEWRARSGAAAGERSSYRAEPYLNRADL